ncbi:hypothetical protein [Pararhodobacter aggregans]|uniref:hypothetical protein n=1 Tax=Pararhodobacter aggregans TaxID=404875 RepID=UPI000D4809B3|nr:hypothetical protein [Pararhodobacter aggregans]PTX02319.1 hypothetical protein C8N33_105138 [Pararhodobacter aggregans]
MTRLSLLSALLLPILSPLPAAAVAPICYLAPVFPQPGATVGIDARILCVRLPATNVRR